ncbi:MAG TPA: nitroreductase/quinone reductase family protein [Candidatus Methylomirabilis sp.]|nr:nitroreductase/quinone reductase family protein [Candidatus Methylomirabilis sp.]
MTGPIHSRSEAATGEPIAAWLRHTEAAFFRAMNAVLEPAVRAGFGSPGLFPTGMIVLETIGTRSGQPSRVPVMASVLEGCVFVGTLRGARSQWMANLRRRGEARYWVAGRERRGRAIVFAPGAPLPRTDGLPPLARAAADGLLPPALLLGWMFAVISPD